MKPIRQFFAVPFYIAGFAIFVVSIVVDLAGCVVALAGAYVEGE